MKLTTIALAVLLLVSPASAKSQALDPRIGDRLSRAVQPDPGPWIELRPKQVTYNHWKPHLWSDRDPYEAADPTRPMKTPDGKFRIDASGRDTLVLPSLEALLHGGDLDGYRVHNIRRWADGTTTDDVWDGLVVKWPIRSSKGEIRGQLSVGYAGMMEQPYRLIGAREAGLVSKKPGMEYNYTRTRHAFDIERNADGSETWTSRGSVTEATPAVGGQWISPGHHHGYGGRPLMDNDGNAFSWDGTGWMIFEQVTEQKSKKRKDGSTEYLPWVTEVVARRMKDPYRVYRKGERLPDGRLGDEQITLCSVRDASGRFNPASDRHGNGYLVEGFNLLGRPIPLRGKSYWIGFASPGNFADTYGVTLWYRPAELGPIGAYQPVLDSKGAWKDVTAEFRARYGLKGWFGRADGFFTPKDLRKIERIEARQNHKIKRWLSDIFSSEVPIQLIAHGINPTSIPPNVPIIGWPKEENSDYFVRELWLLFGRLYERDGHPDLRIIDQSDQNDDSRADER